MCWSVDEDGNYTFESDVVKALGYTDEEIEAIHSRFFLSIRLSFEDWKSFLVQDEDFDYDPKDDQYLKLPTGRVILIPYDLYEQDILSNVDL
jgi:hypothetical protein